MAKQNIKRQVNILLCISDSKVKILSLRRVNNLNFFNVSSDENLNW